MPTLHIKILSDFLTPTNTWNGIKEIKLTMHLFSPPFQVSGKNQSLNDDYCLFSVSTRGVLCSYCFSELLKQVPETISSRVAMLPPSIEQGADWPLAPRRSRQHMSYNMRTDLGKEH